MGAHNGVLSGGKFNPANSEHLIYSQALNLHPRPCMTRSVSSQA